MVGTNYKCPFLQVIRLKGMSVKKELSVDVMIWAAAVCLLDFTLTN